MKTIILTLAFIVGICSASPGQRTLEIISPPMLDLFTEIAVDNNIYFVERSGRVLQRYDGTTYQQFTFPVRDGEQLQFSSYGENLIALGADVYVLLSRSVFRFNGSFTAVAFPGDVVGNIVIYRHKLHALVRTTDGVKLFSYDGSVVTEIPSSALPFATGFRLWGGGYLYIQGRSGSLSPGFNLRYDGVSIRTLWGLPADVGVFKDFFQLIGTDRMYAVNDIGAVYFFDGSTTTEVYFESGFPARSHLLWRSELYFMAPAAPEPGATFVRHRLFKCSGATLSEIEIPSANFAGIDRIAVYRDNLYLPVERDGNYSIHRYNGVAFTEVLPLPEGAHSTSINVRHGKLAILPELGNDDLAFEYNGFRFTEIRSPEEEWIFQSEESARCFHAWHLGYVDDADMIYKFVVAVERADDLCPTDDDDPIIPIDVEDLEHILITNYARDRDWCWTGPLVDWIPPLCFYPPCDDPWFRVTMTDKNGQVAWQKSFDKPFSASIPLADEQPYTMSLGIEKDKKVNEILVLDKELVNNGFEELTLDMYPTQEYFYLTAATEKNIQIPFTMTLRDAQGKSLWQENYTAPMDQLIRAYVSKGGKYLQFSLPSANTSRVSYYPNPFNGKLMVKVANDSDPVTLSDFNGRLITTKDFFSAGEYELNVSGQKSGLYILTILEGKSIRKELVELKK